MYGPLFWRKSLDRKIVYPGQIPLETDLLGSNQMAMVAIGKLAAAMFGTSGVVNGLSVAPNTPASLGVVVSPGEIYQLQNLESTAYSSLPADTNHTVVKQGILLDPTVLACPAPATAGFSVNYLIEASYYESDTGNTVLPFYNASNPSQAFSGPNNTGAQSATVRAARVQLQAKQGIAAPTGSQLTPAADAGYIALAVVTVANGQTGITSSNITPVASLVVMTNSILGMLGALNGGRLIAVRKITASGTYVPSPGVSSVVVDIMGGGASGAGTVAALSGQAACGGGGGGGSHAIVYLTSGFAGGVPVTIGAGGVSTLGQQGNAGGASSFGSIISCPGGAGAAQGIGFSASAYVAPGLGALSPSVATGPGITALVTAGGSAGTPGLIISNSIVIAGAGANSPYGVGSNGPGSSAVGQSASGLPSQGFGAGGAGGYSTSGGNPGTGGAGTPGVCFIYEYA